jgi:Uma2 family endonuclease
MRTAALLSAEDFARVAPILGPCELVKGEIVPMSPGGMRHSKVTGRAFLLLATHVEARHLGHVLTGEAGVIIARRPDTVRGADVAFISYRRQPKGAVEEGFLTRPPELVIEVFGKDMSWDKMEEKIADYHSAGVDLVWVLDPHTETLRAYPLDGAPVLLRDADQASAHPHVDGFTIRVSQFFAD